MLKLTNKELETISGGDIELNKHEMNYLLRNYNRGLVFESNGYFKVEGKKKEAIRVFINLILYVDSDGQQCTIECNFYDYFIDEFLRDNGFPRARKIGVGKKIRLQL